MKKSENIYVSLQLEKDHTSGEMTLSIQFDRNAPNFFTDKNTVSWNPTIEELDFVSEAFAMIAEGKRHKQEPPEETENKLSDQQDDWTSRTDEKAILDRVMEKKDRMFIKP